MLRSHNKDGPDFDVGRLTLWSTRDGTGRKARDETTRKARDETTWDARDGTGGILRDGTGRRARDETIRYARDGTGGMPRDGTFRKPRGEIIRNRGNPHSRWRKPWQGEPAFGPVMGEVCPEVNGFFHARVDARRVTHSA